MNNIEYLEYISQCFTSDLLAILLQQFVKYVARVDVLSQGKLSTRQWHGHFLCMIPTSACLLSIKPSTKNLFISMLQALISWSNMIHDPRLSFDELKEVPLFGTIVIISVLLFNGVHTSTSVKILKVIINQIIKA